MENNTMSIDKKEPIREGSDESMDSTPEGEIEVDAGTETLEVTSVQKRKGGRKPVSFITPLELHKYRDLLN